MTFISCSLCFWLSVRTLNGIRKTSINAQTQLKNQTIIPGASSILSTPVAVTQANTLPEPTNMIQPTNTIYPVLTPAMITPGPLSVPTQLTSQRVERTPKSTKDKMIMVYVSEGEFIMGSMENDLEAKVDEMPQHKIYLDAFWIDKTEVTNGMYRLCVSEGSCQKPKDPIYYDNKTVSKHPVVNIDWIQASTYCKWAGRRLPSEAEWEKAARGVDGRKYPWGNETPNQSLVNLCDKKCPYEPRINSTDDGYGTTAPVGSYPGGASPYGALDMAGNVWEWVADFYSPTYYANSPQQNPIGPSIEKNKSLRGGSWGDLADNVRCANRHGVNPQDWVEYRGFRCATSLK